MIVCAYNYTVNRGQDLDPAKVIRAVTDPPLHNPSLVIFTLIALVLHAKPT